MIARVEVASGPDLRDFLADAPDEWGRLIATRVALRVLPLTFDQPMLGDIRLAFVAWAALYYPQRSRRLLASIVRAKDQSISSGGGFGSSSAIAAIYTFNQSSELVRSHAARAASFAARAELVTAGPESADIWRGINADLAWLESHADGTLIREPLWLLDVRGNSNYKVNFPLWIRKPFDSLATDKKSLSNPWQFWIDWYRAILPNSSNGKPKSGFGELADIEIATKADEFWQLDPAQMKQEIESIISKSGKAVPENDEQKQSMKGFIVDLLDRKNRALSINEVYGEFEAAGYRVSRPSIRGRLNSLTSEKRIKRVAPATYASLQYFLENQAEELDGAPPEVSAGPGPQYSLRNGKLSETAIPPIEDEASRERALQLRLKTDAERLAKSLKRAENRFPELAEAAGEYANLLSVDVAEVDVTALWCVGGALGTFAESYREQNIARTLAEPLEPQLAAQLLNVVRQHGALIMGFSAGRDLVERADEFALDTDRLRRIEGPGKDLLDQLTDNRKLVDEPTRSLHKPVRDTVTEFGWAGSRSGYAAYLIVRNAIRAIIKYGLGEHPNVGAILGLLTGASTIAGDSNAEFIRAAIPILQHYGPQLIAFFSHSPEMRAYVEWALRILEIDRA